eukprot:3625174-Alexandrium_andersonii.AAC.1
MQAACSLRLALCAAVLPLRGAFPVVGLAVPGTLQRAGWTPSCTPQRLGKAGSAGAQQPYLRSASPWISAVAGA